MLETWAAAEPGTPDEGLTVKQEIKAIHEAMRRRDAQFLAHYGGFAKPGDGLRNSNAVPKRSSRKESRLDDYSTWRATRFADPDEIG